MVGCNFPKVHTFSSRCHEIKGQMPFDTRCLEWLELPKTFIDKGVI